MSLAFWKISRNGRWSSPRRSPPAAAARSSGDAAARVDRKGSPLRLNSGDGAPGTARATRAEDAAPPRASRSKGSGREGEEDACDGDGVGRRSERKVDVEAMAAAAVLRRGVRASSGECGKRVDNFGPQMTVVESLPFACRGPLGLWKCVPFLFLWAAGLWEYEALYWHYGIF
jgi:hypothetical protein